MDFEQVILTLLDKGISVEEIVAFLEEQVGLGKQVAEKFVSAFEKKHKKAILSYAVMRRLEEQEREYFQKYLDNHSKEESAECFAEMAVMLERLMIINSFYKFKLKKLEKKLEGRNVFRQARQDK